MKMKAQTAITPTRQEDYPEWYQQVIKAADLAELSAVRGCMVIKPWGYGIWENIQRVLDGMFKATGHKNAYFPLFIPVSLLQKEAEHVEGFAKECAVVTHSRLSLNADGKLVPDSPLEEPLIVRPTSETIIGESFAKWVESYRDLPLLINQWANIVRWEMRTRLFLRTTEFLWQEGHTVHATAEEAREETFKMLHVYADFAENYLAMPVILGKKSEGEKFPGADSTYCIEAMMQDRKALQAGTSHFLGQNFAKASNIRFTDEKGDIQYAWTTSWGVSTRLIGGMVMLHSDDDGLVLPPRLAPAHVVILPIYRDESSRQSVLDYCKDIKRDLEQQAYFGRQVAVELDDRDLRGGEKSWEWVKKGIPIRLEIGPRDVEKQAVCVGQRDRSPKDKAFVDRNTFVQTITATLDGIQANLLQRARQFLQANTVDIDSKERFYAFFTPKHDEIHGGFAKVFYAEDDPAIEEQLKRDLKVTIRCVPFDQDNTEGACIFTGKKTSRKVIFAKSY
ncbi:MAG: proline--tRNA ligase [Verrucomicrobia bacterium GWF2_51_19]|nr:MAG: proline--tRNA ligase [Verrucomicrobia bacterium GWF2_51_19]HCJ11687.1 proline--tRNA ligase [Opitutae bacterium]